MFRRIRTVINKKNETLFKNGNTVGIFGWPNSEFTNFALNEITKSPIRPHQVSNLIAVFNMHSEQNTSMDEGNKYFYNFYSYFKENGILLLKHKNIPRFPLTCCNNRYFELIELFPLK